MPPPLRDPPPQPWRLQPWGSPLWRDGMLAVRLALALDMLGWSLVLSRSGFTFATGHQFDHLARWATEGHWALWCSVAAAGLAVGSVLRGRLARVATVAAAASIEAAIAVSLGGGPVVTTGFSTHVALAALGSWLVWRELADGR